MDENNTTETEEKVDVKIVNLAEKAKKVSGKAGKLQYQQQPKAAATGKHSANFLVQTFLSMSEKYDEEKVLEARQAINNILLSKYGLNPKGIDGDIAKAILSKYPQKFYITKEGTLNTSLLWLYNGKCWEKTSKENICTMICKLYFEELDSGIPDGKAECVTKQLVRFIEEKPERTERPAITFENGVYFFDTGELKPHSADYGLDFVVPCNYRTTEKEPAVFKSWLETATNGNSKRVDLILCQIKYHLERRYLDQIFFENVGDGGCGLTTLAGVLEAMLGPDNVSAVDISKVDGANADRYATYEMVGKAAWLVSDADEVSSKFANLKKITGDSSVSIRPPYASGYTAKLPITVSIFGNQALRSTDKSGALTRRRKTIKFDNPIPKNKRDSNLPKKLAAEIPEIIAYVRKQMPDERYMQVIFGDEHNEDMLEVMTQTESLTAWAAESIDVTGNDTDRVPVGSLIGWANEPFKHKLKRAEEKAMENYQLFCDVKGIAKPIKSNFGKTVADAINLKIPTNEKKVSVKRAKICAGNSVRTCIIGIRLKKNAEHLQDAKEFVDDTTYKQSQ